MSTKQGVLYVVATPIGNLDDCSPRARQLLAEADVILAEDTRTSKHLLNTFGIRGHLSAYHDHNERQRCDEWIQKLREGQTIALISDAGTPLISDPGYRLVRAAQQAGISVLAIPGASAVAAALSVSGLATDRFAFEGFIPARSGERQRFFTLLKHEPRTLVFFEAPHRLVESLADMVSVFGPEREASVARELTKRFERTITAPLADLHQFFSSNQQFCRGEIVIMVGAAQQAKVDQQEIERWLRVLLRHLPPGEAASTVAEVTGCARRDAYQTALQLRSE